MAAKVYYSTSQCHSQKVLDALEDVKQLKQDAEDSRHDLQQLYKATDELTDTSRGRDYQIQLLGTRIDDLEVQIQTMRKWSQWFSLAVMIGYVLLAYLIAAGMK